MSAYNFKHRFVPLIESGQKRSTIRAQRKGGRHARPGERLQLYVDQRTKRARKIIPDPVCKNVSTIFIGHVAGLPRITVDGKNLSHRQMNALAKADGFSDFFDLLDFFEETHGLSFHGVLIEWL
jgi:hypothetical protein